MKRIKSILMTCTVFTIMLFMAVSTVKADDSTELKSLKVYAVDETGKETKVKLDFDSKTNEYDLTVMSNTVSIKIKGTPLDATSTVTVEKEALNTKMDTGKNLTIVDVRSTTGLVKKYKLNTTKLTKKQDAAYNEGTDEETTKEEVTAKKAKTNVVQANSTESKVKTESFKLEDSEMKIANKFSKNDIPEGFVSTKQNYNKKSYTAIKGTKKDMVAFYLTGKDHEEGFYIYDSKQKVFYPMHNIKIKSRMYTVISPEKTDSFLKNYTQKEVTIIDEKVNAWALDESNGMYLVYAMNWNGDTSLYCYDDNEKCFQRYITSNDANSKVEAANKAYNNMQTKYNSLVDKYNMGIKILCGLVILVIIMFFIMLNLIIRKKEKKIKSEKYEEENIDNDDSNNDDSNNDIDFFENEKEDNKVLKEETKEQEEVPEENLEIDPEEIPEVKLEEAPEEIPEATEDIVEEIPERTYGDAPTFNVGEEVDTEGFYGGEVQEEDEILIDLTEDDSKIKDDNKKESDNKDSDDDFEFIDIE